MSRFRLLVGLVGLIALAIMVIFALHEEPKIDHVGQHTPPQALASVRPDASASKPTVEVVPVLEQRLDRTVKLPGELMPYLSVDLYPKVTGILEWIGVDRGSQVKTGQVLVRLTAPELKAQRAEAEAKLRSDDITYRRLVTAASTPGVVAPNDLEVSQKLVEADRARVKSIKELEAYLTIAAPFDGVVTERHVHPGALVGPTGGPGGHLPLMRIEQTSHLRLIVPVPEAHIGGIAEGGPVRFSVPAYPAEPFTGKIARIARSVDVKTRTMAVEMDVDNPLGRLAAGMFPEVQWPVRRSQPTLFVPVKSVVTTTETTFVIRVRHGIAEWVAVRRGQPLDHLMEVFGDLQPEDQVVLRGTDELRSGTAVIPTLSSNGNPSAS